MVSTRKRGALEEPRATSRKARRKVGGVKQAAGGAPAKVSTLDAKKAGVSKKKTDKLAKDNNEKQVDVGSKVRPGSSKEGKRDRSVRLETRRSGRNGSDQSLPAEESPNSTSPGRKGDITKPAEAKRWKGAKPQHLHDKTEPRVASMHNSAALGEGGAEEIFRRVQLALRAQDAEMRAYNGLKSVGCGTVTPRPLLQLSSMDELVASFRNGLPGAEESFRNYFIHPYQAGGPPHAGRPSDLSRQRQTDRECKSSHGNAQGNPKASSAGAVKSPAPSYGDRQMPRSAFRGDAADSFETERSPDDRRPAARPRYDMFVVHRFAMAAMGRRSRRAAGRRVTYTELDAADSDMSSEYCVSEDGGMSSDSGSDSDLRKEHDDVGPYTWEDVFPDDMEVDERCYRSVGAAVPFKTVGLPMLGMHPMQSKAADWSPCITAPCVIAPIGRVRYRGPPTISGAFEPTKSLCELRDARGADGDVSGPRGSVHPDDPGYMLRLAKALNSGGGSALEHFATALCQVVKPTSSADATLAPPATGTEFLQSSWALELKDTFTWYSGYDIVHGMSYIHPLVLHNFVPVHPLYHGDSPRVKWQGPIGKLPRMDPSKDYLRASLQYLRACAVKVGNLPYPPMQVQKLVARQYQHYESMLDRIKEVRRVHQPGGGPMHKNVRVNQMVGRKDLLLTPLLFSPRHLLVGEDPNLQAERDHASSRKNFARVTPDTSALVMPSAVGEEEVGTRESLVTLFDKDLEQPLYRGKRPLRTNDMPPPYPVFKRDETAVGQRKVVYRTREPQSSAPVLPSSGDLAASGGKKTARPPTRKPKAALPPPRAAPPLTQKELNALNRRKERELRSYERRMRLRAEMGEEAWAAEQRRREENLLKKKIQYQTTKKCKDAIEWTQDAAKFPTTQTFNQHMVIDRVKRAIQVMRETHLKKQQNLFGRQIVHFQKDDGVFVRLWSAEDEEEIARLVAGRDAQERADIGAALDAQEARKRKRLDEYQSNSARDTATGTAPMTAEVSSQNPRSSSNGNSSASDGDDLSSTSDSALQSDDDDGK